MAAALEPAQYLINVTEESCICSTKYCLEVSWAVSHTVLVVQGCDGLRASRPTPSSVQMNLSLASVKLMSPCRPDDAAEHHNTDDVFLVYLLVLISIIIENLKQTHFLT